MTEAVERSSAQLMDRIYRHQRHTYDLTRRYYLLGRDRLIAALDPPPGGSVLELGCGTARNLIAAATAFPHAACYGVDISAEMLRTAQTHIDRAGLTERVILARSDASRFDPNVFGREAFDRVFFSYSLSMIPAWRETLESAARLTAPGGGRLHIVDFGQQDQLPDWFRSMLFAWLRHFHVTPRADLSDALRTTAEREGCTLAELVLFRGYAHYAEMTRRTA